MKFTVNGIEYEAIEKNGERTNYCYKTENGKKTRISRSVFDEAEAEYIEQSNAKIDEEETTDAVTETVDNLKPTEKSKLPKGFKIEPNWDGDTTTYLLYKDGKCLSGHWRYEDAVAAAIEAVPTEKPEKPKKRKSKDIAHESNGVTLTAKQVNFICHLPDTCFWDNGLDSEIWTDVLCDDIGGEFEGKPMTVGAMISTLCEKGLGVRCRQKVNNRMSTSFKLTELGKKIATELGVE
nr:MAG TPA: transcriptional regulator SlyA DNA binding protein, structural.6A [Caudoviricetes sp.]